MTLKNCAGTMFLLGASLGARADCGLKPFVGWKTPWAIDTSDASHPQPDLLRILQLDPQACTGRRLRAVRVYGAGNALLRLKVNGLPANSVATEVSREFVQADTLFFPQGLWVVDGDLQSLELSVESRDDSHPTYFLHSVELVEEKL